jgi:hypothetical protein
MQLHVDVSFHAMITLAPEDERALFRIDLDKPSFFEARCRIMYMITVFPLTHTTRKLAIGNKTCPPSKTFLVSLDLLF